MQHLVAASHNIMDARALPRLLEHYRGLVDDVGLDVLCVQENVAIGDRTAADVVAASLGPTFAVARIDEAPGLAVLYRGDRFRLRNTHAVPLPRLERLSFIERLYIHNGKSELRHALVTVLEPETGPAFAAVSFHLEAAGSNEHRSTQMRAIRDALCELGLAERFLAGGDANAFSPRVSAQRHELRRVMTCMEDLGASDPASAPTHFFARQHEPRFIKRLGVLAGAVGIDIPGRYDVLCTNLPVLERGQLESLGSDHDLVWARTLSTAAEVAAD